MTDEERELNRLGYCLRDDTELRRGDPYFAGHEEAYSLCRDNPFQRFAAYAGSREWAAKQALCLVSKGDASA
jgi:hypothetical protein